MLQGRGRMGSFGQAISRPKALPPEEHTWYWHPDRFGVKKADDAFSAKLDNLGHGLAVTWHPLKERWLVWVRDGKIQHPICHGWKLIFVWEIDGQYAPLDERLLAKIFDRSGRKWGNLYEYWLKVEQAIEHEREMKEKAREADVRHSAGEYYDYTLIKNIGSGSKFANHQAG